MNNFFTNQSWPSVNLTSGTKVDFWLAPVNLISGNFFLFYLLIIFLITAPLVAALIISKKLQRQIPVYGRLVNHLANQITFVIIVALSYWFFLVQGISYLSSWLVAGISLATLISWLAYLWYIWKKIIPQERELYLEEEKFFRYIPKSNAKKHR